LPPLDLGQTPGVAAAEDLTGAEGGRLSYRIGIGACDKNPSGIAYETDGAVVVAGSVVRPTAGLCADMLKLQPVSVSLAKPLGARTVLDAVTGQPLILKPR
jgi:hypothetical protein